MQKAAMDFTELEEQVRATEALLFEALRTLAEVGDAEALCVSADFLARHTAPLAQLQQTQEQLERYGALLDALAGTKH